MYLCVLINVVKCAKNITQLFKHKFCKITYVMYLLILKSSWGTFANYSKEAIMLQEMQFPKFLSINNTVGITIDATKVNNDARIAYKSIRILRSDIFNHHLC